MKLFIASKTRATIKSRSLRPVIFLPYILIDHDGYQDKVDSWYDTETCMMDMELLGRTVYLLFKE